ncbi:zinc finger and SCAN domain-containing protein 2 [Drosophila biarmipes]|uniref:zinc finger and SCAN domain-containing protein 2 n=1 Tax=Drosophila biarmipes TaxID=125945 RepID=UPI0007E73CA6|nr:zinc finger and SCAN domain-containing protein 2 [Drosophila biarmipes]
MSLADSLELPESLLSRLETPMDALCRVCHISSPRCLPLFKPLNNLISGKLTTLASILSYCSGLEILETELFLPHHICPECVTKLRLSLEFKRSVHRMDRILRQSHADFCRTKRINELAITARKSPEYTEDLVFVIDDQEVAEEPEESMASAEEHLVIEVDQGESREKEPRLQAERLEVQLEGQGELSETADQGERLHLEAKASEDLYEIVDEPEQTPDILVSKGKPGKTPNSSPQCVIRKRTFQYHIALDDPPKKPPKTKESLRIEPHSQAKAGKDLYETVDETEQREVEGQKPLASRSRQWKPQNPSLQCQICGKQLSTSNSFKYHMQLHGTATPYVCKICGESFKTRNAHDGHVTLHDLNNPNRCPTCFKVYRQASSLRTHLLIHTGIKPFECNICGKRLTQKSGYKKHMLTHTGEKPHGCDVCGRSFRYSSNLIAHKRCHSQEKPHHCQVCQKRSFGSRSELNRHMLVHSSERPFGCEECGKTFKRQVSLSIHQQSHKEGRRRRKLDPKTEKLREEA